MLHHILVKWNDQVADKARLQLEIETLFQRALDVPGIHRVQVLPNVVDRPNRYDLLILLTMEPEALPAYDACEAHHAFKAAYGPLMAQKAIFDCEEPYPG